MGVVGQGGDEKYIADSSKQTKPKKGQQDGKREGGKFGFYFFKRQTPT